MKNQNYVTWMSWAQLEKEGTVVSEQVKAMIHSPDDAVLLAPSVGVFYTHITKQKIYQADDQIGYWEVLGEKHSLSLPQNFGMAHLKPITKLPLACGYQQIIAVAQWVDHQQTDQATSQPTWHTTTTDQDVALPANAFAIEAPIDGMLYHTASPETPPFVQVGDVIEPQTIVALIEVMKFFYEIRYEGQGAAQICHSPAKHGESIEAGQALYYLVPATEDD